MVTSYREVSNYTSFGTFRFQVLVAGDSHDRAVPIAEVASSADEIFTNLAATSLELPLLQLEESQGQV